jgi:hypothetical protein
MSDYEAPLMKKKSFIRANEGSLVSFNYSDIDEGTGYVDFYGGGVYASGAVTYSLQKSTFQTEGGSVVEVAYNCTRIKRFRF